MRLDNLAHVSGAATRRTSRRLMPLAAAAVVLALAAPAAPAAAVESSTRPGTTQRGTTQLGGTSGVAAAAATRVTGATLLSRLVVRTESHNASYVRSKFRHWVDADGDGCDTRNEVLIRESTRKATIGSRCNVTAGRWVSWYDDRVWTDDADVDIDHVVALAEAWGSGAHAWTAKRRQRYANDLGFAWSLDAVTDNVNQTKSAKDPAQWLPPLHRCKYARHWVAIKYRWRLTIDQREHDALARILRGTCGRQTLPVPTRP